MTTEKKFLLKLNLQTFADGLLDFDEDNTDDVELTDEDYDADEQRGPEYGDEPEESETDAEGDDGEQSGDPQEDSEPEDQTPPEPEKKVQTPEENAKFAEQRRQKQLQAEIERAKAESPEFQLAKKLADLYGEPIDVMLQKVEQAAIQKEAKATGKTPDEIQRERARDAEVQSLKMELAKVQYDNWTRRVDTEVEPLKKAYPFLSAEDIEAAKVHLIQSGNLDGSLEDAVYAIHGKKIGASIKEQARQEALAEISGRKSGPAVVAGAKPNQNPVLTAEERHVAKQMGISESEYIKYKV